MRPRAHAAVIHAWAEGATVQFRHFGKWIDCADNPVFRADREYRVKPQGEPPRAAETVLEMEVIQ